MKEPSTIALLRRAQVFSGLGEHALSVLLAGSVSAQVAKGTVLFAEGDAAGAAHLLLSGQVALTAIGPGGQRAVLSILGEGDFIALPPLLLSLPSPVGAVATMPSRVVTLEPGAVQAAITADPAVAAMLLGLLSRHWCALIEQMKDLKLHDSRTRVARWLAECARAASGGAIKLAAPKAMLARNLGMTPESFSRALASLEAAGAIAAAGSSIAILDRGLLEHAPDPRHG